MSEWKTGRTKTRKRELAEQVTQIHQLRISCKEIQKFSSIGGRNKAMNHLRDMYYRVRRASQTTHLPDSNQDTEVSPIQPLLVPRTAMIKAARAVVVKCNETVPASTPQSINFEEPSSICASLTVQPPSSMLLKQVHLCPTPPEMLEQP